MIFFFYIYSFLLSKLIFYKIDKCPFRNLYFEVTNMQLKTFSILSPKKPKSNFKAKMLCRDRNEWPPFEQLSRTKDFWTKNDN